MSAGPQVTLRWDRSGGAVFVDGLDIGSITQHATLDLDGRDTPRLVLTLDPLLVDAYVTHHGAAVELDVETAERIRATLEAAGWTPPSTGERS